ncbi:MAG: hypothetical protein M1144_00170 [Candidatus Thermoplasmatota archaeon]|nr:hypothetical protein [Candidatus Thermoplasmatota archaeon]
MPTVDEIVLFVHILGACVWIGGSISLGIVAAAAIGFYFSLRVEDVEIRKADLEDVFLQVMSQHRNLAVAA